MFWKVKLVTRKKNFCENVLVSVLCVTSFCLTRFYNSRILNHDDSLTCNITFIKINKHSRKRNIVEKYKSYKLYSSFLSCCNTTSALRFDYCLCYLFYVLQNCIHSLININCFRPLDKVLSKRTIWSNLNESELGSSNY